MTEAEEADSEIQQHRRSPLKKSNKRTISKTERFPIGITKHIDTYLIYPPEFITSPQQSRQMSFHILDVIQFRGKRIIHINRNQFPICFSLVEEGHCSEDLDLLDLAWVTDFFADFADVDGVVVAFCFGFGVG
jgi:hypothetical protein